MRPARAPGWCVQAVMLLLAVGVARPCASQPRTTERALADVAVISVPSNLESEQTRFYGSDEAGRLSFAFSSTYLWASMGSGTVYRQRLMVSLMAPDAPAADYAAVPRRMATRYEGRKKLSPRVLAGGSLQVTEGTYSVGSASEPAYELVYADPARRLQLVWHAVKKELESEAAVQQMARIAASFRITREPVAQFAAQRAAPRQEAAEHASRLATVQAMLHREGSAPLVPGKAVLREGVYLEWMAEPEPRYQLLLPLGRVRAAADGAVLLRPRPLPARGPAATAAPPMAGTVGWREVSDGEWVFSNQQHDYLPFKGIAAALATQQQDRGFVYFYLAATVRVEEESNPERLGSLRWFMDAVPAVQRRWREGVLVGPGKPE